MNTGIFVRNVLELEILCRMETNTVFEGMFNMVMVGTAVHFMR